VYTPPQSPAKPPGPETLSKQYFLNKQYFFLSLIVYIIYPHSLAPSKTTTTKNENKNYSISDVDELDCIGVFICMYAIYAAIDEEFFQIVVFFSAIL